MTVCVRVRVCAFAVLSFTVVQMGEEYFHAKDYGKALMWVTQYLWDRVIVYNYLKCM